MREPITMSTVELEALFPELFKIARQLNARQPGSVRMHSIRIGEIDPDTGQGGQRVVVEAAPPKP